MLVHLCVRTATAEFSLADCFFSDVITDAAVLLAGIASLFVVLFQIPLVMWLNEKPLIVSFLLLRRNHRLRPFESDR